MSTALDTFLSHCNDDAGSIGAIRTLALVLRKSESTTMMGLGDELQEAANEIKMYVRKSSRIHVSMPVCSACDFFLRTVTRVSREMLTSADFDGIKDVLVKRGELLSRRLASSRERVASFGKKFVGSGNTVLVHGTSRNVVSILKAASEEGRHFDVIVTEGRPDGAGYEMVRQLSEIGMPVKLVIDAAVGVVMEKVDLVIVGAEGIMENGGVTNKIGTAQIGSIARAHNVPMYVAAESFKFSRTYPLNQEEIQMMDSNRAQDVVGGDKEDRNNVEHYLTDYTPPEYITLIFTDLGVMTPAAVSDELIKLYQA
mmetsp:Transcript_19241/g.31594  ORF Transcript_19241/g.31594 Transcript_19241/m.31594 type:complete len:312 (+) Transcript_19241:125-1060(+)